MPKLSNLKKSIATRMKDAKQAYTGGLFTRPTVAAAYILLTGKKVPMSGLHFRIDITGTDVSMKGIMDTLWGEDPLANPFHNNVYERDPGSRNTSFNWVETDSHQAGAEHKTVGRKEDRSFQYSDPTTSPLSAYLADIQKRDRQGSVARRWLRIEPCRLTDFLLEGVVPDPITADAKVQVMPTEKEGSYLIQGPRGHIEKHFLDSKAKGFTVSQYRVHRAIDPSEWPALQAEADAEADRYVKKAPPLENASRTHTYVP